LGIISKLPKLSILIDADIKAVKLLFEQGDEQLVMNLRYRELEKGACMEIYHARVIYSSQNGKVTWEADASAANGFVNLKALTEKIFKF